MNNRMLRHRRWPQRPHTVAPLTLANFVVTDLASGVGTVYQWSSVTPTYTPNSFCNVSTTSDLCLSYGTGAAPATADLLHLAPQPQPWTAGAFYDSIGGP